jgi:L-threonylcarbamoyladenylate synthase
MNPAGTSQINAAAQRLASGLLVAFPTETVYGLGADALNPEAVASVFSLKGRPSRNPLIVHASDVAMARSLTSFWSETAEVLAHHFWPGPLTIVLPKATSIPGNVTAGSPNVAVRCPDHPVALELLRTFGKPLVGPSANPSGRISPTAAAHVQAYFAPQQVMVLEGGACRAGIESTVVSIVDPLKPVVLRPGVIAAAQLEEVLKVPVATELAAPRDGSRPLAGPGMLPVHYAPVTPAMMATGAEIAQMAAKALPRLAILALSTPPAAASAHEVIRMGSDAPTYARNLYAALMRADAAGCDLIVVERPPMKDGDPLWVAVLDRLNRATSPKAG